MCKGATAAAPRAKVQRWKTKPFQVSGLSHREPGSGVRVRVQVQDLNFARQPHLYLNTRTRDLRAETWDLKMSPRLHLCTGRRAADGRGVWPARPRMTGPVIPT